MIFRSAQFRKLLTLVAFILFPLTVLADPDAEAILNAARVNPMGEKTSLSAQLRSKSTVIPFEIHVDNAVRYVFENPRQELILKLEDKAPVLTEHLGGETSKVRRAQFDKPVRDTGITYEDLALRFLYWKNPILQGEDVLRTRKAWKIEIQAGRDSSQYGVAWVWIDQQTGAILRMEGYDRKGRLRRRFEVISAKKIDGQWMLKQMRVETFDPTTKKILNRTYLEILDRLTQK
jgi:hypothetical protein